MSTRSIIGTAIDGGFVGRYCHWDGYPTARATEIVETYHELGEDVAALVAYAIRPDAGPVGYWSSYGTPSDVAAEDAKPERVPCTYCAGTGIRNDEHVQGPCNGCRDINKPFDRVTPGTGVMSNPDRTTTWQDRNGEGWCTAEDDCGAEWAYLLSDAGLTVLSFRHGTDGGQAVGMFGAIGAAGYWRREMSVSWAEAAGTDWELVQRLAVLAEPVGV